MLKRCQTYLAYSGTTTPVVLLLFVLLQLLLLMTSDVCNSYEIIPDKDVAGQNLHYGRGTSAIDCANQCKSMSNCVAISWNAPASPIHDGNCNFKCRMDKLVDDKGEQAVVVRPGLNLCNVPPPPPPAAGICDPSMPADWLPRCRSANLFYAGPGKEGIMPALSNGYLGTIAGSEKIYAGGLFNGDATGKFGHASHRAAIPTYSVAIGESSEVSASAFDIERAIFIRRGTVVGSNSGGGGSGGTSRDGAASTVVNFEEKWYAHATRPSLLVHQIDFNNTASTASVSIRLSGAPGSASPDLALKPAVTGNNVAAFTASNTYVLEGANIVGEDAKTPGGGNHTQLAAVYSTPCNLTITDDASVQCIGSVTLKPGTHTTINFITAIVTSLNSTAPLSDALAVHTSARTADPPSLLLEHTRAWRARWDRGSLEVEGDLTLAQAANSSLYALRAAIRDDFPYGLSPGGLATDGYNGHTFWDQETWMWPPLLMLDPPSAAAALAYRHNRIAGAELKASTCGQPNHLWCPPGYVAAPGALAFPWESAFTGHEVQFNGGKIGPWGEYEQHISGDIAFAARQYYYATGDKDWLKAVGFPLVRGVAAFYANRVTPTPVPTPTPSAHANAKGVITSDANASLSSSSSTYDFLSVMGPDEYAYPVNNSRYTNAVASLTLAAAVELAPLVGARVPGDWIVKAKGLSVNTAPVPKGSGLEGLYHPEYDGYPRLPGHGAQVKQADTIMLSFPFGWPADPDTVANDLRWYDPNTNPNGPAMTYAMFAINWINEGRYTRARQIFRRGFAVNVKPPFMVWTETPGGGCTPFLTGAGGFLQSLVFGTSGMRLLSDRLTFKPPPPSVTGANATATGMRGVNWRGTSFDVRFTAESVTFVLRRQRMIRGGRGGGNGNRSTSKIEVDMGSPILVTGDGSRHVMKVNNPIVLPRKGTIEMLPPTAGAV